MTAVLAVDLGKTGCRAAVWTEDGAAPLSVHEVPGAPGLASSGGVIAAETAVRSAAEAALKDAAVERLRTVCVGAAGAAAAPDAARALAQRLLATMPTDEAAVTSDAVTAHAGALGGEAGVVLAIGTGAVTVAAAEGAFAFVDGWGPWLGDEGGGAWIGLAGLRAALRAHDGRGAETALRTAAIEQYGALEHLPATVSRDGSPARSAAAFAPAVARAAARGDRAAGRILRDAADALADAVSAAARRIGDAPVPVAVTGGLTHLGAPLLDPLTAALTASAHVLELRPPLGDPLDGARLLALRRSGPHEPFVTRLRHRERV
ncbi:BadF/BadG/BcrA/BcrD ATPase family protein [Streptomyces sp. NPDC052051]|uniref:BadF/BadG/BcrA/BcrD ATPase family protein n=1 Tax=Streptomyces sp. NPDC052051 TaxID=3154649 RepID=UPI00342CFDC5